MKKYTEKQITEAIEYWENKLKEICEDTPENLDDSKADDLFKQADDYKKRLKVGEKFRK